MSSGINAILTYFNKYYMKRSEFYMVDNHKYSQYFVEGNVKFHLEVSKDKLTANLA
jgi:hypothetical protein